MIVVLAEKPSVARDLARHLRANQRQDGYFEGGGYQVTWALGHLVGLKDPDEYDSELKRWSLDRLPFVPDRFELKQIGDRSARKQFATVKRLFRAASEIICATDAGREGELIFRYILELSGCVRKPVRRLWLSSLTDKAITDAFNRLQPGGAYDNLYAAARCRCEADWIIGINATRNFTVRHGKRGLLWSAGRVQTPVLAMIVHRDDEIRCFRPEPFWELITEYREVRFKHAGDRFPQPEQAHELLQRVNDRPFTVTRIETRHERSLPPLLYDLTGLQRDMNRRFGMSADETLLIAQSLYEAKAITYPRTDSNYLSHDMKREVPKILSALQTERMDEIAALDLTRLPFNARIVNDAKVTDHHAIIPTTTLPASNLSGRSRQVYDAIVTRLIAVFYPACVKEITVVHGESNEVPFRARGVRVVEPGWTSLYPKRKSKDEDDQELPLFARGESGAHRPAVMQGETRPPRHFTENSLLGAMETAGKLIDDETMREAMKEHGLGTPATRASIIETLLKRDYIQRSKKQLTATDLGRFLIAVVQDEALKSPELTGRWEAELKQIEAGRQESRGFMSEIIGYADNIVRSSDSRAGGESRVGGESRLAGGSHVAGGSHIVGDSHAAGESEWGSCPRCGRPVIQGKRGYGCSGWKEGCKFALFPEHRGVQLEQQQVRELLRRRVVVEPVELPDVGRVILYLTPQGYLLDVPVPASTNQSGSRGKGGRRTATGRTGTGRTGTGRTATGGTGRQKSGNKEPGKRSTVKREESAARSVSADLGDCPLCGEPVAEQKKSYSCSGWKSGCGFVIWKTMSGKRISSSMAKKLISRGETAVLKGFKSKAGKTFSARLKLVDGAVRFEFD